MSCLNERIRARLRDNHGFMLAEQMVSVVFLGLLCVAIAAGLGVCIKVQRDISSEASAQSLLSEAIQEVDDQLEFSTDVKDGQSAFVSGTVHQKMELTSDAGSGILMKQLDAPANVTVLVGEKSGNTAVFAQDGTPVYSAAKNAWTYTIEIVDGSGQVVKTQSAAVKRVGAAATAE